MISLLLIQPFRLLLAVLLAPMYGVYCLAEYYDKADSNERKFIVVNSIVVISVVMAVSAVLLCIYTIAHQHGVNGK